MRKYAWILLLAGGLLQAQPRTTVTLAQILSLWSQPAFETSEILIAIDNAGLVIEFNESNLASVFEAAKGGSRTPKEIAQVLLRLLKDCRNCRDQFWAPLSASNLLAALAKGPVFAMDELRVRGATGLPLAIGYIGSLKKAGATPPLVGMVEDRLPIPAPAGFKEMKLEKAPDFNPLAAEGKLTLRANIDSEVIFLFRHNALFFKTLKGDDPVNLGCTFTAFGPASESQEVKFLFELIPTRGAKPKKNKSPQFIKSVVPDPSGRPGLQLTVNDIENGAHPYEMELKWTR